MSKFIVFEGVDRAGKSTAVEFIRKSLEQRDIPVLTTITKCVAGNRVPSMVGHYPDEIVYMFFWQAIRSAEITIITPALKEGTTVLCDRYVLSNLVDDWWEDLEADFKRHMDEAYLDRCQAPDLTFVFTIPYDTFISRDDGQTELTRARFEAVQQSYIWWAKQLLSEGICVEVIDGTQPEQVVCQHVLERVLCTLGVEVEVKV